MQKIIKLSQFIGRTFAFWAIGSAILGYVFPSLFSWVKPYITYFLGIIMFGMGLTLSPKDFVIIFKNPKAVGIGVLAQYTVMPMLAWLLAKIMNLPDSIALGMILVGAAPGGTASNVITYLAKGDVALSVAITSCSTLLAPFITPLVIYFLVNESIEITIMPMFQSILTVVFLPVILGLVIHHFFKKESEVVNDVLPLISVFFIVLIIAYIVSMSKSYFHPEVIFLIFAAVVLHNLFGLALGYFIATICGLPFSVRKTLAIEVGMQNSGLAVILANKHFASMIYAPVPAAIFSIWHNVSGSLIASYWANKEGKE